MLRGRCGPLDWYNPTAHISSRCLMKRSVSLHFFLQWAFQAPRVQSRPPDHFLSGYEYPTQPGYLVFLYKKIPISSSSCLFFLEFVFFPCVVFFAHLVPLCRLLPLFSVENQNEKLISMSSSSPIFFFVLGSSLFWEKTISTRKKFLDR